MRAKNSPPAALLICWILITALLIIITLLPSQAQEITVTRIATGLLNPRGIAVLPDGRLLVIESGMGRPATERTLNTGRISLFEDLNGDGLYTGSGEITPLLSHLPSYNAFTMYNSQSDEVGGAGDIVVLKDGQVYFTMDDRRQAYAADGDPSVVGVMNTTLDFSDPQLRLRTATVNALVYDDRTDTLYAAESGLNRIIAINPAGGLRFDVFVPGLAHSQQPVPSGMALDPLTGDLLIALFSGSLRDYDGGILTFLPGDAKVVRLDPETQSLSDVITGLTTAVDVATNERGDIFVVEFTSGWPTAPMPPQFDLYDPDSLPDPGGYARFAGRVSMVPANGGDPVILAQGLDTPTNITYHDGALYVSTGQGTPGRRVVGPDGVTHIIGEIYKITGFMPR